VQIRHTKKQFTNPQRSQRLDATAHQNRLANAAAYKAWVESHTPIEIDAANRARRQLRKIMPSLKVRSDIKDDRLPKLPTRAFAEFVKAKWASGDLGGERSVTVSSKLGSEWKSLSAAEKKVRVTNPYEPHEAVARQD
jgi:hypothetical protein